MPKQRLDSQKLCRKNAKRAYFRQDNSGASIMQKLVYVDNNATTKVDDDVLKEMMPYFSEKYGNPSSIHSFGGSVAKDIEKARESVANLLGASPNEIIFTGTAT